MISHSATQRVIGADSSITLLKDCLVRCGVLEIMEEALTKAIKNSVLFAPAIADGEIILAILRADQQLMVSDFSATDNGRAFRDGIEFIVVSEVNTTERGTRQDVSAFLANRVEAVFPNKNF